MPCIVFDGNRYLIGQDFASTVTAAPACHGMLSYSGSTSRYLWQSSLPQDVTEHAIRAALAKESKRLTFIQSQAV